MSQENEVKGYVQNLKTEEKIDLANNPQGVIISKLYNFEVKQIINSSFPSTSFSGGGPRQIQVSLNFNDDISTAEKKSSCLDVIKFFSTFDEVDTETRSVPPIKFVLGEVQYSGYLNTISIFLNSFDKSSRPVDITVNLQIFESVEEAQSGV